MQENLINLNSLIQFIVKVCRHAWKHWIVLSLVFLCGLTLGYTWVTFQKIKFVCQTSFVVEDGKSTGNNFGNLSSLAGQFGVDLGAGSSSNLISGDNLNIYLKSNTLAKTVLLKKVKLSDGKPTAIANVFADVYGLNEKWLKDKKVQKSINFDTVVLGKSRLLDSLLQNITYQINNSMVVVNKVDKKSSVFEVTVESNDEEFSFIYCDNLLNLAVERYIEIKSKRQKELVAKLERRSDSVLNLMNDKVFSVTQQQVNSSTMDVNPLYKANPMYKIETSQREKSILSTLYASIIQNLELARFNLSQETPVFQIIDSSSLPLKTKRLSRMVVGGISGILALAFYFIIVVIGFYRKKGIL